MPTIKDIAKAVGVSATTVSNVIHGNHSRVSAGKVAEIEAAILEMGYVPNLSARSLVSHASHIIGVINYLSPKHQGRRFLEDPYYGALFAGMEQSLRKHEYYLMVRTVYSTSDLMSLLTNWNLDGLILVGLFPDDFYDSLFSQRTPFLLIDSYIDNASVLQVRQEDRWGGYIATRHLLEKGHRDILFCGSYLTTTGVFAERFAGYRQALSEFGLEVVRKNVLETTLGIDEGMELGRKIAERQDFTGIFATADVLAAGLMSGLQEAGRTIPDEISIIGFDDLEICRITHPPLTSVHQDVAHKGEIAVDMLVHALQEGRSRHQPVVLPVHVVQRGSTMPV